MAKADDIRRSAAQRLRELLSKAAGWEESVRRDRVGGQTVDLVVKFKMGGTPHALAIGVTSLGQPRQIREVVTRLFEFRKDMPEAYPVAVAPYISPQSAALIKRERARLPRPVGQLLPGLRQRPDREGGQAEPPALDRPLKVALRAPGHPGRPGPARRPPACLAARGAGQGGRRQPGPRAQRREAAARSCPGSSATASSGSSSARPGELLDAWVDAYTYRPTPSRPTSPRSASPGGWWASSRGRPTRRAGGTRSRCTRAPPWWRPNVALPGHPLLRRGRPRAGGPGARATAGRGGGQRLPDDPVRRRGLLRARWSRAGSRWSACPSSTPISITTSGAGGSRPRTCGARRWATESPTGQEVSLACRSARRRSRRVARRRPQEGTQEVASVTSCLSERR